MAPSQTKVWSLANYPKDLPTYEGSNPTFELKTTDLPSLKDDQVLVKTLFLSNDPAQRTWISDDIDKSRHYTVPVQIGESMRARSVAEIVESKSSNFKQGDIVTANTNWQEYAVLAAKDCTPVDKLPNDLSYSHYLGAFGLTGLTAYYGLVDIGEAKKGETVVVSGAAGATGSMVVQIAKHIVGCDKVIGMAGSDEKCRWVEKIGADKCLNYKDKDFEEQLKKATGQQADLYFDNVAGEILDKTMNCLKKGGRVAQCGAISAYNSNHPQVLKNYFQVVSMRLSIRGFIVLDAGAGMKDMLKTLTKAYGDGKLDITEANEHVVDTKFEDIPKTWLKLFDGSNTGKLITKL